MTTIQPVNVERDEDGFWVHPDLPSWDENITREEFLAWQKDNQISLVFELFSDSATEEQVDKWFESAEVSCSGWTPECALPGAFLLSIHDTEDGPVAMFAVPDIER